MDNVIEFISCLWAVIFRTFRNLLYVALAAEMAQMVVLIFGDY